MIPYLFRFAEIEKDAYDLGRKAKLHSDSGPFPSSGAGSRGYAAAPFQSRRIHHTAEFLYRFYGPVSSAAW